MTVQEALEVNGIKTWRCLVTGATTPFVQVGGVAVITELVGMPEVMRERLDVVGTEIVAEVTFPDKGVAKSVFRVGDSIHEVESRV